MKIFALYGLKRDAGEVVEELRRRGFEAQVLGGSPRPRVMVAMKGGDYVSGLKVIDRAVLDIAPEAVEIAHVTIEFEF